MAKRQSNAYLSSGELVGGTIFFVVYLLVLPFATEPLFRLISILLDVNIGKGLQNTIYYYVIFALTVIIFHGLLARTSRNLMDNLGTAAKTLGAGLIALYGLNELVYRLTHMLIGTQTNLNDMTINAQIDTAPRSTLVIVILLAPFVEEVLFRGLVFGGLRSHSRTVAYLVSCLLFAFLHVWQYAWGSHDVAYFWLMVQYLVPGMVLAWAYDHSGTLWTSVGLHTAANALSVLALHF
ncbi:CPBP intramembrane metalloprotease [anaerobic digester metagenome]|jgi:membrane protease YdiL (CAAX protease family)